MQIASPLTNELQLGSRLNSAIEHDRRGEFGLLLAMLSADSRDMAQFQFDKDLSVEQKLFKQLELPQPQKLCDDLSTSDAHIDNSSIYREQNLRQFQLQQNLTPEALVIRGKHSDAMVLALGNASYLAKQKYENNQQPITQIDEMHFIEQLERQRQICKTMIEIAA